MPCCGEHCFDHEENAETGKSQVIVQGPEGILSRDPTSTPRSGPGWSGIRAGRSTSRPHPVHGSTPSKASSRRLPGAGQSGAGFDRSPTFRSRSIASSPSTTGPQSPSFGGPIPTPSSQLDTRAPGAGDNPLTFAMAVRQAALNVHSRESVTGEVRPVVDVNDASSTSRVADLDRLR